MQYVSQKARFSRCKAYRYSLEREWDGGTGHVVFIGLNPSTADHQRDDPTIRRCVRFARDWGFSSMEIVNLFAFRATLPSDLKQAADPIGKYNNRWIKKAFQRADLTVACWGNDGVYQNRAEKVIRKLPGLHCIDMNQSLQPAHPLYLKANLEPKPIATRITGAPISSITP